MVDGHAGLNGWNGARSRPAGADPKIGRSQHARKISKPPSFAKGEFGITVGNPGPARYATGMDTWLAAEIQSYNAGDPNGATKIYDQVADAGAAKRVFQRSFNFGVAPTVPGIRHKYASGPSRSGLRPETGSEGTLSQMGR